MVVIDYGNKIFRWSVENLDINKISVKELLNKSWNRSAGSYC